MTKSERASYLVNLLTLIESKAKSGHAKPSESLGREFEREYVALIKQVKDEEDETR